MRLNPLAIAAVLLSASLAAHADTASYDFTYSSTNGDLPGETATGNGAFTIKFTPGVRSAALTAFSFTDTIDSSLGDSTFSYSGLHDVSSSDFTLALGGDIVLASITTDRLFGTDAGFGSVDFSLQQDIRGTVTGNTSAGNIAPDSSAGNTNGAGTITFVSGTAATPEPSSLLLLGTGLLGVTGVIKRRFA